MNNRVLLIIGSFKTGGAERVTINTGSELQKLGYDVYYALQRGIFELPNNIPREKIFILRKSNSKSKLYKIYALFIGIFLLRLRIKPRVVIGFSRLSSLLACFSFCSRVIARFDANPYRLSKKQHIFANIIFRWPLVRSIVVPSTGMYKAIAALQPKYAKKLVVIANTIDVTKVLNLAATGSVSPYDFSYMCAMGRFSYDKNFELLIRAYSESSIKEKLRLVLIGDGKLREELKQLVNDFKVEDRVIFTGFLSNPYPVLKHADFLVNPSRNESFCNVILEGLTLGLPVIATDCDYGPADMIKHEVNGFLIENDNLTELVKYLNIISENPRSLTSIRAKATSRVQDFQLSSVINKWIFLIQ